MTLDLADGVLFRSHSARKMPTPDVFSPSGFYVDDATLYSPSREKCRYLDLAKEQKAELVPNTLAAIRYLKSQMSESWYFVAHGTDRSPVVGDATCVDLSDTDEQVNLLMVKPGGNATLCLFVRPDVVITGRTMQFGDAIEIMDGRPKPQVVVDSFSLEQAVQPSSLIAVLGTQLQHRIVSSSLIADFSNGLTSPPTSRTRQYPQMSAQHEQGIRIPRFSSYSGNTC